MQKQILSSESTLQRLSNTCYFSSGLVGTYFHAEKCIIFQYGPKKAVILGAVF